MPPIFAASSPRGTVEHCCDRKQPARLSGVLTRVARRRSFWLEKSVRTAIAVPMANDPPFATLNHVAGDLGIPSESALLRIGISRTLLLKSIRSAPEVNNSSGTPKKPFRSPPGLLIYQ